MLLLFITINGNNEIIPKMFSWTLRLGFVSEEISMKCSKACTYLDITYGYPFIYDVTDGSTPFITLYFKTSVAVRESHLAYDLTSLFAEIGGYTGLLLGISIADFTKMFKVAYENCYRIFRRWNEVDPLKNVIY